MKEKKNLHRCHPQYKLHSHSSMKLSSSFSYIKKNENYIKKTKNLSYKLQNSLDYALCCIVLSGLTICRYL